MPTSDKAPETLRSCECAVLRHRLEIATQVAVAAKKLTLQIEPIVNDIEALAATGGYSPTAIDQALIDAYRECVVQLSLFGAVCVQVEAARGIDNV